MSDEPQFDGNADGGDELQPAPAPGEQLDEAAERQPVPSDNGEGFTAGEKIASVLAAARALAARPDADPQLRDLARLFRLAERFGLVARLGAAFPPLDDDAAYSDLLALVVGVALNLQSDGTELDVDECRAGAALILRDVMDAAEAPG